MEMKQRHQDEVRKWPFPWWQNVSLIFSYHWSLGREQRNGRVNTPSLMLLFLFRNENSIEK